MGEVYLAEDTTLKRQVALKVLPPELATNPDRLDRFQREAESLASLNHPNIVTIYSVEEDDGIRFLTTELVEGRTLGQVISSGGLALDRLFEMAVPLADALSAAHAKGVVHRDLKPSNVMVTVEGRIKVLDFGLAKLLEEDDTDLIATEMATEPLTREGTAIGTMPYMSPEQVQGKTVDHRSDIFSLGVVLYEMATGDRPFQGETSADLVSSILRDQPDSVTEIRQELPRHLGRIIRHCLEKDPQRRYQAALDVRNEIEGLRQEVETGEVPASSVEPTAAAGSGSGRPGWLIPAAVAGVIVVAGLFWFLGPGRTGRPTESAEQIVAPAEKETDSRQMMVVLPFENLGAAEDEYFAAGMTEEITSRLASVGGIGVISRKSAVQYADTNKSVQQIGDELGVGYLLEGTVRWARSAEGSRVRITPQLIRIADDTQLWSDTYDRVIDDIFEVQSDIAGQVIDELGITLLEPERQSLEARPTENLEAYQAYLRGRDQTGRLTYSEEARNLEVEMLQRAVELDPQFAQAWALLSKAHSELINLGMDKSPERLTMAREAVDRALELDPDLPEAHLALAFYHYWGKRDYDSALRELAIAQRSIPDHPGALVADFAIKRRQGPLEESLASAQRAFELSPRDDDLPREIGNIYVMMGDFDAAQEAFDQSISLAPDQQAAYAFKAFGYWSEGDLESANRSMDRMPQTPSSFLTYVASQRAWMNRDWPRLLQLAEDAPVEVLEAPDSWLPVEYLKSSAYRQMGDGKQADRHRAAAVAMAESRLEETPLDPRIHRLLGLMYAEQGRREEALEHGRRALELYPPELDALHGPTQVEGLSQIYVGVGDFAAALEQLDRLLSYGVWTTSEWLEIDPAYDPIRNDPGFQKLLEKHRRLRPASHESG